MSVFDKKAKAREIASYAVAKRKRLEDMIKLGKSKVSTVPVGAKAMKFVMGTLTDMGKSSKSKKENILIDMIKKARKSKKSTKTNPYRIDDKEDIMRELRRK